METLNKNKEEIEKILKEIERLEENPTDDYIDYSHLDIERKGFKERIETSIEWCEDWIEKCEAKILFLVSSPSKEINGYSGNQILKVIRQEKGQLQTHLTWLKEQENR